jgi:hypothetical protein
VRGRGSSRARGRGGTVRTRGNSRASRGRGGRGGRGGRETTHHEIDLEHTDNEQEEEDEPMSQDLIDFLDNREYAVDGTEQAIRDNESLNGEDNNEVRVYQDTMKSVRGRKRARKEEDGDDAKPRNRQKTRQLQPLHERGLGETSRLVSEYHLKAPFFLPIAELVTPWEKQPGRVTYQFGPDVGKLEVGAFGDTFHRNWINDRVEQGEFAKLFFVPMFESVPLRVLSNDIPSPVVSTTNCRTNSTNKVLHAFRMMHRQTELDYMQDKFYEKILIGSQRTSKEIRLNLDCGPFGGLQGKIADFLWTVYVGDDVSNFSTATLQLAQAIATAVQGSKGDELCPMVRTQYTEPYGRGRTGLSKVQGSVQTARMYNFHESELHSGRFSVNDIDVRLTKRIWKYRFPDEEIPLGDSIRLSKVVDSRFKRENFDKMYTEVKADGHVTATDPVICDLWLFKDIYTVVDATSGYPTKMTIEGIYLCAKTPACDPLIILKSMSENNPNNTALISKYLSNMINLLGCPCSSWDQLFNTDRAAACEVVSEAAMLKAAFLHCHRNNLRNLNIGGFRMDVLSPKEMTMWDRYMNTISRSRKKHFEMMTLECLSDRLNYKNSRLPVENWPLDIVHGQIYWKVPVQRVLTEMEEYENNIEDEDYRNHVKNELYEWCRGHYFEDGEEPGSESKFMYLCEGVGFAMNTGIFIKIRGDFMEDFEKVGSKQRSKQEDVLLLPQPYQQNAMVNLWAMNMLEATDPFDEVFTCSQVVPDMDWLNKDMGKLDRVFESMHHLRETVGEFVMGRNMAKKSSVNARLREIMILTGKERNSLSDKLISLEDNVQLKFLYNGIISKIITVSKQTFHLMTTSELALWRVGSYGVRDLKKQSIVACDEWKEDYSRISPYVMSLYRNSWQDLLVDSARPALFYLQSLKSIKSDLSYMNTMLQIVMRNSSIAFGMNTPGSYGMTLRIGDMGIATKVLVQSEKLNGSTLTTQMIYDTKFPGMGIDQCTGNFAQQCNACISHLSLTREHKDMAMICMDTSLKTVSKLSYATLQGSAVIVNNSGEIWSSGNDFQNKCGNLCFFSEWGKDSMDLATMGCIESNLANSGDQETGGESGIQQSSWQTTQMLESMSDVKIRKLPILFITGNKPSPATPASAIEGGRWMHIPSSTQDNDNGLIIMGVEKQARIGEFNIPQKRKANQDGAQEFGVQAFLTQHACTSNIRKDIKIIKREVILRNRAHFLLMQWMKRDAVFFLSALSCDPKCPFYTMRSNFPNLESSAGILTFGMRREYLQKLNGKFWHRNVSGPWKKVMQTSTHVYSVMSSALLHSLEKTTHGYPLDLSQGFHLGIRCLMTQNISFTSMINSLHIWLSSAVLDANFMVLSSYMYHFSGFQGMCSLRVLSLALLGLLTDEDEDEWKAYISFCNFMAPCLLEDKVLQRNASGESSRGFMRNVKKGVLRTPKSESLSLWLNNNRSPGVNQENPAFQKREMETRQLEIDYCARTQGPVQETFSVYCQPRLSMLYTDMVKGFGRSRDGQTYSTDENVCGTAARCIATMFAREQKPQAHRLRESRGDKLSAFENTETFWTHVHNGTAFPQCNNTTNDVYKLKFEDPQYTGIWWEETMSNAGLCDGILKNFLLQSGMDPRTVTEHQFWTKLLTPYLDHLGCSDTKRVYGGPNAPGSHKNAWGALVVDKKNVFEFSSLPSKNEQNEFVGVNVNVCMRLIHYMIVQGLGLTKDWTVKKHDNASRVSSIHLRNLSHMSLGLLSVFLHTCCDKALIPVNSGKIRLMAPTPDYQETSMAFIEYDNRLHTETHQSLMGGRSDNMLSVASRMALSSNWDLISLNSGVDVLWYASATRDNVRMGCAGNISDLFSFPPEAVAHAAYLFDFMYLALRRYGETLEKHFTDNETCAEIMDISKVQNHFAVAMLLMGERIEPEFCEHMQPSLTDCVVRDRREIPCVTLRGGYLFTIFFDDGCIYLRPTHPTHQFEESKTFDFNSKLVFGPLPLRDEKHEVLLPSLAFPMFFSHGLKAEKVNEEIKFIDISTEKCDRATLPFYFFPVMHFPVLHHLEQSGWLVSSSVSLLLHTSEYFYWKHQISYCFREANDRWLKDNCPDICKLISNCTAGKPDINIHPYFADERSKNVLGFWVSNGAKRVHFNLAVKLSEHSSSGNLFDTSLFCVDHNHNHHREHGDNVASSYLMLDSKKFGLSPLLLVAGDEENKQFEAQFTYMEENGMVAEEKICFPSDFSNTKPRMLPLGEDSVPMADMFNMKANTNRVWGLTIENENGAFISDGCYTMSYAALPPRAREPVTSSTLFDFLSASRCNLREGSEVWINVTNYSYGIIQEQCLKQGYNVMLAITAGLHNDMQSPRLLRGFYVLGGSDSELEISSNFVTIIFVLAGRKSVPGRDTARDDNANSDSYVNQKLEVGEYRIVSLSIPLLDCDHKPMFTSFKDESLPIYKYLKERPTRLR